MGRPIFIDRDGVINVDPIGDYVKRWEDFRFEAGALEALKTITDLGFEIILISNQAGIGDGVYPESALWDIQRHMLDVFDRAGIRIRASHYCLHGKQAGCKCRKPEIGLFQEAVRGLSYDPGATFFIGDKATDMEAGRRFGIRTIMVRTGHGALDETHLEDAIRPDFIVDTLKDAAALLASL